MVLIITAVISQHVMSLKTQNSDMIGVCSPLWRAADKRTRPPAEQQNSRLTFISIAPLLTWKMSDDPSAAFGGGAPDAPQASASTAVTSDHLSLSLSVLPGLGHLSCSVSVRTRSGPKTGGWIQLLAHIAGFFMGHYVAEEWAVNEAITAALRVPCGFRRGGGHLLLSRAFWVYLIISYHLGSCQSRMSSWTG